MQNIFSYLILSYLILSYLILSYHILPYLILSYLILSYLILSYLISSYLILSHLISSHLILSSLLSWPLFFSQSCPVLFRFLAFTSRFSTICILLLIVLLSPHFTFFHPCLLAFLNRYFQLLDSSAGPPLKVITTSYLPANAR